MHFKPISPREQTVDKNSFGSGLFLYFQKEIKGIVFHKWIGINEWR